MPHTMPATERDTEIGHMVSVLRDPWEVRKATFNLAFLETF